MKKYLKSATPLNDPYNISTLCTLMFVRIEAFDLQIWWWVALKKRLSMWTEWQTGRIRQCFVILITNRQKLHRKKLTNNFISHMKRFIKISVIFYESLVFECYLIMFHLCRKHMKWKRVKIIFRYLLLFYAHPRQNKFIPCVALEVIHMSKLKGAGRRENVIKIAKVFNIQMVNRIW